MAQPQPPPPSYPFAIPSMKDSYPALRDVQNIPQLSSSAAEGAPLDPNAISDAKAAVVLLSGLLNAESPSVTPAIVESAENRLAILRQVHGSQKYGGGNIMAMLAQIQASHRRIETKLDVNTANIENLRRRQLNARDSHGHSANRLSHMVAKTIPGSGHVLAYSLRHAAGAPIVPLNPVPDIGAIHHLDPRTIDSMTHADILDLIAFYNEDFGITAGDNLAARRDKVKEWLV
ncbi:hypothetical protein Moror_2164 [Moniliophthora roreri MCA 2997]|uniref:Uncharacterized protein n=2 Tax=Moniliophthora roreri TaxID=221103 RepID=V2XWA2_MONRO|nr:hypothetical protein Moror_2164 [Moniliophthora roreri MCA 2997]KAI3607375.1 hypothetical protein WG66_004565 [Moniliophthora roreri]